MRSALALALSVSLGLPAFAGGPSPSPATPPRVEWLDLFESIRPSSLEFSAKAKALAGKRVRFRGWALTQPVPKGGLFLTANDLGGQLHPDDEDTLPWDTVAVLWAPGVDLPKAPRRPTVEGTLRLGNRRLDGENVIVVLEDARPYVEPAPRGAP